MLGRTAEVSFQNRVDTSGWSAKVLAVIAKSVHEIGLKKSKKGFDTQQVSTRFKVAITKVLRGRAKWI